MKDYFSKHYAVVNNINPADEATVRHWYAQQLPYYDRELLPHLPNDNAVKVLEAGCGIGGLINYMQKRGFLNIEGIDLSPEQVAVAKKYITENVQSVDIFDFLADKKEMFDVIIMFDIIEHLPKARIPELVEQLYHALKSNGRVIMRTPNMASITGLHSRYIDFTHETGFTPESIKQIFMQQPYKKITVHNAYIGRKRLAAISLYHRFIEKLYNISLSKIVTSNLTCVVIK